MHYGLLFFSLVLTAFGQPAWIPGFGSLAAAFGFAFFWKAVEKFPKRFLVSTLWFTLVQGVQLSWLATPDYMGPLILPFYLLLIFGVGLQFGMLSFFVEKDLSWPKIFALSGAWVICEWLRLFFLCGFTWNPTGLALADSPYSLQFASIWGIYGLSFWVILVNLTLLKAWNEKSLKQGGVWACLALFPYLFGLAQESWVETHVPISKSLKVALVQTNLAPEEKEFDSKYPEKYIDPVLQWKEILSTFKGETSFDLIVLPEAALPLGAHSAIYDFEAVKDLFPEEALPALKRPFALFYQGSWRVCNAFLAQALANQYRAHVIIGLDDRDLMGKYNAAFQFSPTAQPHLRYEKQILAPIGEYIPLRNWIRFSRFIGDQFGIFGSFDAGKEGKVFPAPIPIGISICLEETFTSLIRDLRLKGAELFVSVSNDAYFPRTKLGRQHFDHGRVRAAENGTPLLRSCNSGMSSGIDCFGRPFKILNPQKKTEGLFFSFPVRIHSTLYTFWGDTAILGQSVFWIATYLFFKRKKKLP